MNYTIYRLRRTTRKRSRKETGKIKDLVKGLEQTLRYHKFYWEEQIKVFYFFAELARECDSLDVSEGLAHLALS